MFQLVQTGDPLPKALRQGVIAIGNFDGVHLGHQAVLGKALEIAQREGVPALALTFEPHPRDFFKSGQPVFRLTPAPEKALLLKAVGLDGMAVRSFDAALSALTPQAFFEQFLVQEFGARHLVVGKDFHFGKNRAGTPDLLKELGRAVGIGISFLPPQRDEAGEVISSSRIRAALEGGDVEQANRLLGYRWFVEGIVQHGDKRGRALGFPTANIALPASCRLKYGVYAGRACVDGYWFAAALHFGTRAQFGDGPPLLEAYLLDFNGELYGKTLRVEFMAFLRHEQKFENVQGLVAQMQQDVERARALVSIHIIRPQSALQGRLEEACISLA